MQTRETPHPLIADITACMAANKAADVDRSARFFLDSINKRLRHHRKILSDPVLADLYAGENWAAPGIRDLIRESELHRAVPSAMERSAAYATAIEQSVVAAKRRAAA